MFQLKLMTYVSFDAKTYDLCFFCVIKLMTYVDVVLKLMTYVYVPVSVVLGPLYYAKTCIMESLIQV